MPPAPAAIDAVLLVSFGGPEGPDDVMPFLENVTRGRGVPAERLAEVARQYDTVGGVSPINDQCRALLAALGQELAGRGLDLPLYWGNRNWHPFLTDTVRTMADDGVGHAVAVATSAYSSYSGCRQYLDDIAAAREAVGPGAPVIDKVRPYYDHPGVLDALHDRLAGALAELDPGPSPSLAPSLAPSLVFTAHSIPVAMAATCDYERQLRATAAHLVERVGHAGPWALVWQSRSGPPQVPWLEPDVGDHLRDLAAEGVTRAVVVPIGFVSDHMEVVNDLDVIARRVADEVGIDLHRVPTVGTHPRFVEALADLVVERLDASRPRLGLLEPEPRPEPCRPDCCPPPTRPATRPG